jgi:hypothetical protein
MAPVAFISHASGDKTAAAQICAGLEQRGIRCWIAPRDITPGAIFPQALIDAVGVCSAVVLVFSAHANGSEAVLAEVGAASKRKKPIVPFRIEDVQPMGALEFYISQTHWLDAFDGADRHLDRLAAVIRKLFDPHSPPAPEVHPATAAKPSQDVQVFFHGVCVERTAVSATRIADHFQTIGWQVERGYTELAIHRYGLWVHGSSSSQRAFAVRELQSLGFEPRIDDRTEDVPLQIIVGQPGQGVAGAALKVSLKFVDNTGGTPGLHLKAINGEPQPLESVRIVVTDIRRWNDDVKAFVTSRDIYESGTTFLEMEIGKATLHAGEQTNVGFIRCEGFRVELNGTIRDSSKDHYRITTGGIWQVSLRVDSKDGRSMNTALCFRWEGPDVKGVSPTPWDCPSPGDRI